MDDIKKGKRSMRVSDEWEDETQALSAHEALEMPSSKERAYLIVLSGSGVGSMVKVTSGMTIGRGVQADFQTQDEGASRLHVRIVRDADGQLIAEDLESLNGTFVNGEKINRAILNDGDKISIGSTTILKFSYADHLDESFQKHMYDAALRDPLTQVFNRRYFDEQLLTEFSFCVRNGAALSLIVMDLDHFKKVNDEYGHPVGDVVLTGFAKLVADTTRQEDLFARCGGEEFMLLCRGTTGPSAFTLANRIRVSMEQQCLVPDLPDLRVTVSAGIASMPERGIRTVTDFVEAADSALYQAKSSGRNRVCIHSERSKSDKDREGT